MIAAKDELGAMFLIAVYVPRSIHFVLVAQDGMSAVVEMSIRHTGTELVTAEAAGRGIGRTRALELAAEDLLGKLKRDPRELDGIAECSGWDHPLGALTAAVVAVSANAFGRPPEATYIPVNSEQDGAKPPVGEA